jgi:hypothetical protein
VRHANRLRETPADRPLQTGEEAMKKLILAMSLCLLAAPALAKKPCEELKSEIEARLRANGVKSAMLEIVGNDEVKDNKVVGSCDGGSKKITYKKG